MPFSEAVDSRVILTRLREAMAEPGEGQERLDRIVKLIARGLVAEVCSVYLRREDLSLELCATEGLNPEAVHTTRLAPGQGLVGRIAESAEPIRTRDAAHTHGFRFLPETGEEIYSSFLGVPIQRLGEVLGVLVVQNRTEREYSDDEIYALEVVAMVIAEMAELGAFVGPGPMEIARPHRRPFFVRGLVGQEGVAEGRVVLHEPQIVISQPISDDPALECARLRTALEALRAEVDEMLGAEYLATAGEHRDVLNAYRMFANDKGWVTRMEASIVSGLAAEVAVEKEQSATRARMSRIADPYLRERLHDFDDLANRLLRLLAGSAAPQGRDLPDDAILVARNIGPAELLDYGRKLSGVVLEEGSVGSHAAIVARALAIPLVIHARRITREAQGGDHILVDGDQGVVHLRPEETVAKAFREKVDMLHEAQAAYVALRDKPARTRDGVTLALHMNAGLIADLPSLPKCGAIGVGLFRTELQFLVRSTVPRRADLAALYARILDSAGEKPVVFRTLDIGSDKVLPYMRRNDEPNPALGWRAIRVGLDRPGIMRMQVQALLRGARGRPLQIMYPFVAEAEEFEEARELTLRELAREQALGHRVPAGLKIGAMLETPSLAFAPDRFFEEVDFLSIGGNDLKQFFFAADRENELVRRRYDMLSASFLAFIEQIVARCASHGTPLSYCGEDAGRPVDAVGLAAMGLRSLSMRPASIGPVKALLRQVDLEAVRAIIEAGRSRGLATVRPMLEEYLRDRGILV
ncbi:MAG TPA: phosphoenolpyruvate--protein phosphotransferase [Amaricoccus sp.]|uniref:phosphoenolpyruvate--protein phosphotransferase n=1 Tax=Amaricoccus sp. TaxID=1872485 RepID=UPI002C3EFC2C|nr:phosphoenolpyruvate--protein phosphotransferase [Amaricoccus sp.]HMQ92195.1 phosphoenolpyruvate--protein phosphotransferase [Amaricoccus sp.]HMR52616.1 phosphoenolpyruvate--protein phosphotransferase [Amaricoccus sp.]HMR59612.1 phosphoenolpyruvate--protein phosphotransferase [Amaricoccus sp.]HMT99612.1 phosphoenolpyruvate--protein phosphotransferase [Amaricoccus sp.]